MNVPQVSSKALLTTVNIIEVQNVLLCLNESVRSQTIISASLFSKSNHVQIEGSWRQQVADNTTG